MIARYAVSTSLAMGVTSVLLFIMQLLISTGEEAVTEFDRIRLEEFVRVERNEVVATRAEKPRKPQPPEAPPKTPPPQISSNFDNSMAVSLSSPAIDINPGVGTGGYAVQDGEYLPIVKVAPVYPARALARKLEGYVLVEFTVTTAGTVTDVAVIESTSPLFEQAAVDAALKFKYKPRIIAGQPVEVLGVRNRITFTTEES